MSLQNGWQRACHMSSHLAPHPVRPIAWTTYTPTWQTYTKKKMKNLKELSLLQKYNTEAQSKMFTNTVWLITFGHFIEIYTVYIYFLHILRLIVRGLSLLGKLKWESEWVSVPERAIKWSVPTDKWAGGEQEEPEDGQSKVSPSGRVQWTRPCSQSGWRTASHCGLEGNSRWVL